MDNLKVLTLESIATLKSLIGSGGGTTLTFGSASWPTAKSATVAANTSTTINLALNTSSLPASFLIHTLPLIVTTDYINYCTVHLQITNRGQVIYNGDIIFPGGSAQQQVTIPLTLITNNGGFLVKAIVTPSDPMTVTLNSGLCYTMGLA